MHSDRFSAILLNFNMKINTQQYLKYSLFLLSFFFFYLPTYSQIEREISDNCDAQGWCWGQNPDVARDHFAYFSDQYDFKEYPLALKPLEWLLENAPKLHKNLYIRGEKIYKENIKIAKSVEEKISLEDKLLTLYQSRIDYFGQEAKVIQKQGKVAYLILKSRKDKEYDSLLYEFYHKILRLNTNKTYKTNLVFLTNSIITLKNKGAFSDTDVLVGYEEIFDILNYNLSQKQSKKQLQKWKKTKQNIDKLIVANIDLNCELIQKRAKSQFHNSTKDSLLIFAQRFYNYSNLINCKKSIIYLKTLETIFEAKPTVEIVLEIAQYHYQNKKL